jgi:hypothetical protein
MFEGERWPLVNPQRERPRAGAAGVRGVRRGVRAAALRAAAPLLLAAVPAAGARQAAARGVSERPGPGGAGRPFCEAADSDPDVILEQIAERIAAEVEARPPACLWCLARLTNCSAFCGDVCREDYHRKLMPPPFARSTVGSIIPDVARVAKRKRDVARAAAWRAAHAG